MQANDRELRQGAIDALLRLDRHRAIERLRELRHDRDAELRLYASVTLAKLGDDFGQEIRAAQARATAARSDPQAWEDLATIHLEYALSGLADEAARSHHFALARQAYEAAPDVSTALALARAHLLVGEPALARPYVEAVLQHHPEHADAHLALLECDYLSGALDQLSQRATDALSVVPADHPQRPLIEWWAWHGEAVGG
jgi:hypothetical protein